MPVCFSFCVVSFDEEYTKLVPFFWPSELWRGCLIPGHQSPCCVVPPPLVPQAIVQCDDAEAEERNLSDRVQMVVHGAGTACQPWSARGQIKKGRAHKLERPYLIWKHEREARHALELAPQG